MSKILITGGTGKIGSSLVNSIEKDIPVEIGNSEDALKLMNIIDKVYEQEDF